MDAFKKSQWCFAVLVAGMPAVVDAQSVQLLKVDATVWLREQRIAGRVDSAYGGTGMLWVEGATMPFTIDESLIFSVPIELNDGTSRIVASVSSSAGMKGSDTLRLTMAYPLLPEILVLPAAEGRRVTLVGHIIRNPYGRPLTFHWSDRATNPSPVSITVTSDSTAEFELPASAPPGEYVVAATAVNIQGDTARARAMVTVRDTAVIPFDRTVDHAQWIDDAVVYELSPSFFTNDRSYASITTKLPELKTLGITAVWLQPVTQTNEPCQGYHVLDYFRLRPDLGTESELRQLVETAHGLGMRVMFDIVPNHTSLWHAWAVDAQDHGPRSHYYDFYQRSIDTSVYAWTQFERREGEMDFVYFFWPTLMNLNFQNPEVQEMMIRAGRTWIERFDIDGYRVDAVWGVDSRAPDFMTTWRDELKRIKPDVFLLGETKASWASSFERRYDAAFDWSSDPWWISLWAWARGVGSTQVSLFMTNELDRSGLLRAGLTNNGLGFHPRAKVLRYMENNDTDRFLFVHGHARTRMVATLIFSLPGIPMIYNGQEAGEMTHPYDCQPVYQTSQPIRAQDPYGYFPFYQNLTKMRRDLAALRSDHWEEVPIVADDWNGVRPIPGAFTFAYRRWAEGQEVIGVVNMSDSAVTARLRLPLNRMSIPGSGTPMITDLITGASWATTLEAMDTLSIDLPAYTTRLLVVADSAYRIPTEVAEGESLPTEIALEPNYPNPFNAGTQIAFSVPTAQQIDIRVYDLLGREVAVVASGMVPVGRQVRHFDAGNLASGVYLIRLTTDAASTVRRMVILR